MKVVFPYYPHFALLTRGAGGVVVGVDVAVLLSYAMFHFQQLGGGFVCKTTQEIIEETGLTRWRLNKARKILREMGFLVEERRGAGGVLHFWVDIPHLIRALDAHGFTDVVSEVRGIAKHVGCVEENITQKREEGEKKEKNKEKPKKESRQKEEQKNVGQVGANKVIAYMVDRYREKYSLDPPVEDIQIFGRNVKKRMQEGVSMEELQACVDMFLAEKDRFLVENSHAPRLFSRRFPYYYRIVKKKQQQNGKGDDIVERFFRGDYKGLTTEQIYGKKREGRR